MKDELLALLRPHGQEHLLAFWDRLDWQGQQCLARQVRAVDWPLIERLYGDRDRREDLRRLVDRATDPPAVRLDDAGDGLAREQPTGGPAPASSRVPPYQPARQRGREAIRADRLGVVIVAGGQGTRLGFDHPKGMFPVGPVSGHSLFQIHAEKVLGLGRRYGVRVPLLLMTSPATHDETVEFFARHGRFGLAEDDLLVFCQGTMPALDAATGKALLAGPDHLALSPDGHGGLLAAMARSGALDAVRRRGIRHLFYLQVDNPLVEIGSPRFVGHHVLAGSEMSTQVIAKRDPMERLGNVVQVDGRLRVIEYSDLPEPIARRRKPDGSLAIWAGSIAVHVIDTPLLERMAGRPDALPFHVAHKKVSHLDPAGRRIEPDEPNALKFERFIFDLIPWAEGAIVVEVDPAECFAPLKNAPGAEKDTPESVQAQMVALHRRWLRRAGVELPDGVPVELSPLWALDADAAAGKVAPGTRVTEPTFFC